MSIKYIPRYSFIIRIILFKWSLNIAGSIITAFIGSNTFRICPMSQLQLSLSNNYKNYKYSKIKHSQLQANSKRRQWKGSNIRHRLYFVIYPTQFYAAATNVGQLKLRF